MTNVNGELQPTNQPEATGSVKRIATIMGVAGSAALMGILASNPFSARGEEVPCDPEMDVCVPGVTAPPDEEYVPGNPIPGDTIPIDPEFDDKGPTTVPETTVPETTVPETTVPETTVPETTVPETTVPETTVVVTTVPPTMPPITVEVPEKPEHTK
jgi:hypothetical protein